MIHNPFKKILFIGLFVLAGLSAYSQNDSITFNNALWIKRNIIKGVTLQQYHFRDSSLFNSNQYISILKINPEFVKFDIVADTVLIKTSEFANKYQAAAAINGSFFDMAAPGTDYNSVNYLRVDNTLLAPNQYKGKARLFNQGGSISIFDNNLYVVKTDQLQMWEKYIAGEDVITSGPLLRIGGENEKLRKISFNKTRHPRTAVAKVSDTLVLFIVVDGRSKESAGMSMEELQTIVTWLGAVDALNLDGGGSSAMYVLGNEKGEIVNHPSDNKKFDNQGERRVANAIIVTPKSN